MTRKTAKETGLNALGRVRHLAGRKPLSRRLIPVVLVIGGLTLFAAGVGIAGKAAGWWSKGEAVRDPVALRSAFADPSFNGKFIKSADLVNARTVAVAGDVPLLGVPQNNGGYCITPSIEKMSDTPIACDDGPDANTRDMFMSWSIARGQRPVWLLAGRITDAGAARISLGDLVAGLETDGFFEVTVPPQLWERLSGASVTIVVSKADGTALRQACVTLGVSPPHTAAGGASIAASNLTPEGAC